MKATFQVLHERIEAFTGKRGRVEQRVLALLDLDPEHPLLNTVDFLLGEEDRKLHANSLMGRQVQIGVNNVQPAFGGRLRIQGRLLTVV